MPLTECAACEALWEQAIGARTGYLKLVGRLEIAKLSIDKRQIVELEPQVETARIQSENVVANCLAHQNSHG